MEKLIKNWLLFSSAFILFFAISSRSEDKVATAGTSTEKSSSKDHKGADSWAVRLGYFAWQEKVYLTQGNVSDQAFGNFFGNSLSLERTSYFTPQSGLAAELFLLTGTASAGGTQSVNVPYSPGVLTRWSGGAASVRYAYLFSESITATLGPIVLTNSIDWPVDSSGTTAKSVSNAYLGMVADLRYQLNHTWEVRQMIGALSPTLGMHKVSVLNGLLWNFSIGCRF